MDWVALNSKSTTRQIVRPLTEAGRQECLLIKQAIRDQVQQGMFVVDAFVAEAARSTIDDIGRSNGGLCTRTTTCRASSTFADRGDPAQVSWSPSASGKAYALTPTSIEHASPHHWARSRAPSAPTKATTSCSSKSASGWRCTTLACRE